MMLRVTNYAARKAFKTIASSSNANYVFAARLQSPQMKIVRYFSEEKHEKVKDEVSNSDVPATYAFTQVIFRNSVAISGYVDSTGKSH